MRSTAACSRYQHTPALDLKVSADKLALPEIARLVPALRGFALQPAFELTAKGPLAGLRLAFNTRSSAGQIDGDVVTDLTAIERRIDGTVNLRHLDIAPLLDRRTPNTATSPDAR